MADINLSQADADVLIVLEKHRTNEEGTIFPQVGRGYLFHYVRQTDESSSSWILGAAELTFRG